MSFHIRMGCRGRITAAAARSFLWCCNANTIAGVTLTSAV
ncbi:hypothetical protein CLOSTHATH_05679 [Hungatella hathewayi DSM 13479]|uniref:Uncharacterized protein n=1 Tax=Hungatella hathewayi DSM 13479 TaxID=566550 RepID=D3APX5_9FIRM|nr:hypothetical protein CLOSTHATH_05679 [Hungatella hathewayi DSM 13479]